ncbi:MAG: DJ-1/PfpI family protein [Archangium sp.]
MSERIAVLLNEAFADWEVGYLTASARDFLNGEVKYFTPHGKEATSEGGLRVASDGRFDAVDVETFGAVIVCGSGKWAEPNAADISTLLKSANEKKRIIGVICAGTLTAARAGLFDGRPHTSNGAKWLGENAPGYRGASHYRDVNEAVVDGNLISAPGSAPVSFAKAVLSALFLKHEGLKQTLQILGNAN